MTDFALAPVGLGTGGAEFPSGSECVDAVSTALELGYRHVDTAVMYGNHEDVGRGIRKSTVAREEITLSTKVPPGELGYQDVIDCLERSRDELGLDRLDVGYVHFPGVAYDPEETLAALSTLVDDGTVGHVGVSNFSTDQLSEAHSYLGDELAVVQAELHPLCWQPELVEWVRERDLPVVGYAPLARGRALRVDEIAGVADKHGASPAQVVLAWLTGKPNVVTVVKSTRREHLAENLRAPSLSLEDEDVRRIESTPESERLVDPTRYE